VNDVLEKGKINVLQMGVLVFFFVVGDMILVLPSAAAVASMQDSWICGIVGIPIGVSLAAMLFALYRSFPDKNIIQLNRMLLGKWFGGAVSLLILLYFILNGASIVREVGDFVTTVMMPETPINAVNLLLVLITIWSIRSGIEPIARTGEILLPWFLGFFLLLVVCLMPQIHIEKMMPIMGKGLPPVIHGLLYTVSFPYAQMNVFLMILPYVKVRKHMRRDFLLSAALGGIVVTAVILLAILVLGPYLTSHEVYPAYGLAKKINIGDFLERLEAVLAVIWIVSTFMKCVLYGYAFTLGSAQLFSLREYQALNLPAGLMLLGLAYIISPNIMYYTDVLLKYWPFMDLTFGIAIPLLLLLVGLRKRRGNAQPKGAG